MTLEIPRRQYVSNYGPTVGDRVRLADTELIIEVEEDFTTYGEEIKFGGGKTIRDGMGQSPTATRANGALDLVITNALILDWWGIVKADVGIRDGYIVGIGKAGNPNIQAGVTPGMVVGPSTEVIAGENLILTAGGIDAHVHFICPQLCEFAIASGVTTLLGGRNWAGHRQQRHHLHPWSLELGQNVAGGGGVPRQFGLLWQGERGFSRGSAGTGGSGGLRTQDPRRLGIHAGSDR